MAQFDINELIKQLLPQLLAQPRSQDEMTAEAEGLYNPYYNEMYGETEGDYDRQLARLLQDSGLSEGDIGLNRSRFIEDIGTSGKALDTSRARGVADYGTQEERLNQGLANLGKQQAWDKGAFKENLISSGLGDSGIGIMKRQRLAEGQAQDTRGFQNQLGDLGTQRARFLEDIDTSRTGLDTRNQRGLSDFATQLERLGITKGRGVEDIGFGKTRGLRDINRQRSAAIQGYINDPNYQFYL